MTTPERIADQFARCARRTRSCDCLRCHHQWTQDTALSLYTANLSGEASIYCPKCGTREVSASPIITTTP